MAYTTPTPYFETASAPATSHAGLKEFATFLNGVHATQSNAVAWECIDCYDGTTREQPTGGSFANLTSANLWREDNGTPPQDSWAVFQAPAGGDVTERFQVYIEMTVGSAAFLGIFMLNDWAVGAGSDAAPTIPATSLGVPPFAGGMDGTIGNHSDYLWQAHLDEGTIHIRVFPTAAGTPYRLYFGDLDSDSPLANDARPFVVSRDPAAEGWNNVYLHVSLDDDTTIVDTFDEVELEAPMTDVDDQDAFVKRPICTVAAYSILLNDRYRKGKFRLCGAISRHARSSTHSERVSAGVGLTDYDFEVWGRGGTAAPQIVVKYPPGTALDVHEQIVESTIPDTLET